MNYYFLLAVVMSLAGPFCYAWIASRQKLSRFVDGLITAALVCLVSLHILPESLQHAGYTTFIALILGLVGPLFFSHLLKRNECEIQKPFLLISIFGLIAHNMLDGAALVIHPHAENSIHLLALAVGIHRFVESIVIYKAMSKSFSNAIAALALGGLSLAMIGGFFFGEQIFTTMDANILHMLQALACGMIFHVILHPHHFKEIMSGLKKRDYLFNFQSAGAICGLILAFLAFLFWPAHDHSTMIDNQEASIHGHATGK